MTTYSNKQDASTHRLAFGARVRSLREQAGMSQEELAHTAGLHRTYVSSLERGQRNVGLDNIVALARSLEVTTSVLLQGV
ncbi:helix-turn-helix domain-containing protein [Streptomyces sp. NPDC102406]|uniref:helix-turn-helix domain-containing protein n=1 Tax=Streptomyces sp. NPDC102406 TaxID=3366171 RepID=UPI0038162235